MNYNDIKTENREIAINVDHVTVRFNLSNQKINNLKEYAIKLVKRELMFQEFLAVKDASFQVPKGEAWALIGSNGSGKSTLLKAISGIIKPYKGSVTVNGSIAPLIELGAGFDGEMTARENIFLNGCLLGHSEEYMQEHFDEIVEFAEVGKFLDSPIKNYSSGMKARLGFAIATVVRPEILIVDEILAVGDIKFQQKCAVRMNEMLKNGTTLLFVSHSIPQVRQLCNKAVWIEKGDIISIGNVNEVCDLYEKYMESNVDLKTFRDPNSSFWGKRNELKSKKVAIVGNTVFCNKLSELIVKSNNVIHMTAEDGSASYREADIIINDLDDAGFQSMNEDELLSEIAARIKAILIYGKNPLIYLCGCVSPGMTRKIVELTHYDKIFYYVSVADFKDKNELIFGLDKNNSKLGESCDIYSELYKLALNNKKIKVTKLEYEDAETIKNYISKYLNMKADFLEDINEYTGGNGLSKSDVINGICSSIDIQLK